MKQFVSCREMLGDGVLGDEIWVNLDFVQTVYPYTSCPRSEDFGRSSFGDVMESFDGVRYVCSKRDVDCEYTAKEFSLCILTFGDET